MSDDDNLATIESIYAAFGRGDLPFIVARLAEHVEWQHPGPGIPWAGNRRGRAAVMQFFATLGEHLEIEQFVPGQFVGRGNQVIVLGRERVRVKSTGRVYETDWVHVWTLETGAVVGFREYTDTATILESLAGGQIGSVHSAAGG